MLENPRTSVMQHMLNYQWYLILQLQTEAIGDPPNLECLYQVLFTDHLRHRKGNGPSFATLAGEVSFSRGRCFETTRQPQTHCWDGEAT